MTFVNRIFRNLEGANRSEIEALYHDIQGAGVILPSGEGRSKGALSIACSEMAKMRGGKLVLDRGDIGFPGRNVIEADADPQTTFRTSVLVGKLRQRKILDAAPRHAATCNVYRAAWESTGFPN